MILQVKFHSFPSLFWIDYFLLLCLRLIGIPFFFELVDVVWFMLMNVSCDEDIINKVYELVMEHSLISIVSGFWIKKCIQTLWINVDV